MNVCGPQDSTGGNAGGVSLDHPQPPPTTQSSHGSSANGIARDGLHSAAENERCDDREEDQEADEEDEDDDLCEDVRVSGLCSALSVVTNKQSSG